MKKLETKAEIVEKCKFFLDKGVKKCYSFQRWRRCIACKQGLCTGSIGSKRTANLIQSEREILMVAGFIAGFVKELSPEDSFKLAVASGSANSLFLRTCRKRFSK